ncbi:hypothetical protein MF271_18465 (plasmid) [Deinococcus sp. KNUC1210]|uniref:hypothetical protein n=1 Tax=Deinococcus sp. KNUC1210 TaxID=2917691 RepID=UPI001EF15966|nr:hypothetical protein [Deinococcus sp. KNUC1210]ULH17115.1 hypothetical protein MF271_18465 [Deinococcus sp. KNUC1210]
MSDAAPPTDLLALWATRLQHATAPHRHALNDAAALETAEALWSGREQPLAALQTLLTARGLLLDAAALQVVAWSLLLDSVPKPSGTGSPDWTRLTGIAELHDLTRPGEVAPLVRLLSDERWLTPDLLQARPWLPEMTGAEDALLGIFDLEWSGFLTHLGSVGPWVYAAGVADVQALAHAYGDLVRLALSHFQTDLLAAAFSRAEAGRVPSLLARLGPLAPPADIRADPRKAATLLGAEESFWAAVQRQARQRTDAWAARRSGG